MLPFTGNPLDRASERRSDSIWLAAKRADVSSRVLPLWKLQPFLPGPMEANTSTELGFVSGTLADILGSDGAQEVFLGLDGETAYFARDISAHPDPATALGAGHFRDVRVALPLLSLPHAAILGQAKALLDWHARHGFCSACGRATRSTDGGHRRICAACGTEHFPRTDPAVIMLVTDGERCLLGRNKRFAGSNIYSALAGFIEAGESIEEAVRREVLEEVAIRVGEVRYFAAQPWPFPSSLMIGCFGQAQTRDITIDGNEIIAARWFERAEIRRLLAGENYEDVTLPRREAIAYHLIRNWAEQ